MNKIAFLILIIWIICYRYNNAQTAEPDTVEITDIRGVGCYGEENSIGCIDKIIYEYYSNGLPSQGNG